MNKQFDLIVWDWDGTLSDSTGMIANALIKAAAQTGLPELSVGKAKSIIGLGLRESIHTLFGEISDEQSQQLVTNYKRNYYAGEEAILLYEGAYETIVTLNKRGYKLAVATGKARRGLNLALEHCGLANYFHQTRTVDECFSKPHPQMLDELMDHLVALPERTLMIGDTSYDLQMAQNAGVMSVGVSFGAQSVEELTKYQPKHIFKQFSDLKKWLLDDEA